MQPSTVTPNARISGRQLKGAMEGVPVSVWVADHASLLSEAPMAVNGRTEGTEIRIPGPQQRDGAQDSMKKMANFQAGWLFPHPPDLTPCSFKQRPVRLSSGQ